MMLSGELAVPKKDFSELSIGGMRDKNNYDRRPMKH